MFTLLASCAQEESRSLSFNVKWAICSRYAGGITNSHRIYGYTWKMVHINNDEARIIRRVYCEYLEGISPKTSPGASTRRGCAHAKAARSSAQ